MSVRKFLPSGKPLNPRTIEAVKTAYQKAMEGLAGTPQPLAVQEIIAKRIIRAADEGEADPEILCDHGLASLGLRRSKARG